MKSYTVLNFFKIASNVKKTYFSFFSFTDCSNGKYTVFSYLANLGSSAMKMPH